MYEEFNNLRSTYLKLFTEEVKTETDFSNFRKYIEQWLEPAYKWNLRSFKK